MLASIQDEVDVPAMDTFEEFGVLGVGFFVRRRDGTYKQRFTNEINQHATHSIVGHAQANFVIAIFHRTRYVDGCLQYDRIRPYTIVLKASIDVPRAMKNRDHEIGLRMPNNAVCRMLVDLVGEPLLVGSVSSADEEPDTEDPELLERIHRGDVNFVLDAGQHPRRS